MEYERLNLDAQIERAKTKGEKPTFKDIARMITNNIPDIRGARKQ